MIEVYYTIRTILLVAVIILSAICIIYELWKWYH